MARSKSKRPLTARQKALRHKEAARKASVSRAAKKLGLTVEQYQELSTIEFLERLRYQRYMTDEAKKQRKKPASAPDLDDFEEIPPPPEPEPPEFDDEDEDFDDFEPDWGSMSKSDLVIAMLNMMTGEEGKKALRVVLSEIPSDDYPELASKLWNMDEADRTGYLINYHSDIVNQRRAAEQEFMQSEEFAEEVGGAVDPTSWM